MSTDSTVAATTPTIVPATGGSISWTTCPDSTDVAVQCGSLKVPYDYSKPSVGQFTLHLERHLATNKAKRIGSMLVNPGGPGFGGSVLAEQANSYFSTTLINQFDIVGWDPRGTGKSTPAVDCIDDYDKYFALPTFTSVTDTAHQALVDSAKAFDQECQTRSGAILPYISTNNTARDMDTIRAALGETKITYFGFSYGSELGATWVTLFPSTVRAAVIDGAADPTAGYMEGGLQQAKGFDGELEVFLTKCSADKTCPFYNAGNAAAAYDALAITLHDSPLTVSTNRAKVNDTVMYTAVSEAMYSSDMWPDLQKALANAQKGDGKGLLALYDQYYERNADGTYGNELEAFMAISCLDDPGPKSVEKEDSYNDQFMKVAPRLGRSFTGGYSCVFWPTKEDKRVTISGKGAGPIVVVGTTGDPATPLEGTRKMASTLEDGRLIVVTGDRHTGYGINECVVNAVDTYLITASVSFKEKAC